MANVAAVRTGIKTALEAVDNLNSYDYEAFRPQPPAAVVKGPITIDPRQVFGDAHWNYEIPVQLFVGGTDSAADARLDELLAEDGPSSTSVVTALRADPTLGGVCGSADVTLISDWGVVVFDDGAVTLLSATITVEVFT